METLVLLIRTVIFQLDNCLADLSISCFRIILKEKGCDVLTLGFSSDKIWMIVNLDYLGVVDHFCEWVGIAVQRVCIAADPTNTWTGARSLTYVIRSFYLWWCNGNAFHVTGPLWGDFPHKGPVTQVFIFFFDGSLNKLLNKQSGSRWFKTHMPLMWRPCNVNTSSDKVSKVSSNEGSM